MGSVLDLIYLRKWKTCSHYGTAFKQKDQKPKQLTSSILAKDEVMGAGKVVSHNWRVGMCCSLLGVWFPNEANLIRI